MAVLGQTAAAWSPFEDPSLRASVTSDRGGADGSSGSFKVEAGMPPVFLAAGYRDRPDIAEGLAAVYLKYKAATIPAELHIFANAGPGFGHRPDAKASAAARWPERFTEWLGDSGLLK